MGAMIEAERFVRFRTGKAGDSLAMAVYVVGQGDMTT